jgi:hypothetical protein
MFIISITAFETPNIYHTDGIVDIIFCRPDNIFSIAKLGREFISSCLRIAFGLINLPRLSFRAFS